MAAPSEGVEVQVDEELTLHVEWSGEAGRPVLLVPGWTMTTAVFVRQIDYFRSRTGERFITYDPRGHGRSTDTPGGHYYEQHGRDLHALIDKLELDQIVLGGWSYGVLDTLAYIDQFGSDRVAGLVVLDGSPRSRGADNLSEWVSYRYDDADGREEFFTMGPLRDRDRFNDEFARWMLEDQSQANLDWIARISNQTRDEVAALLNAAGAFLDYTDVLARMNGELPLLYVVSQSLETVASAWSRRHTPAARVAALGKHLMFWERAEAFNAVLQGFLDTVPWPAGSQR